MQSTQRGQASLEWFENLGQYTHQQPSQFAFNIMTRSRRVTHDSLRVRDPEFVAGIDEWFAADTEGGRAEAPPMFQPFRPAKLEPGNRVVVSPMDMYVAKGDGVPTDFHFAHLGEGARRRGPGHDRDGLCLPAGSDHPGLHGPLGRRAAAGWARITDFVHRDSQAKIGLQLGHSGRKGSTKLMWEGIDQPLETATGRSSPPRPPLPAGCQPGASRDDPGATWHRSRPSSSTARDAVTPPASTCSSCTAPTATSCPRSSPR